MLAVMQPAGPDGAHDGEARQRMQVFGAGGYEDQAATWNNTSSTAVRTSEIARLESEEVLTLAQNGPLSGDRQLTKAGSDAAFIQAGVANANPEFNHRALTHRDAHRHLGGSEADLVTFDILDGISEGDTALIAAGRGDPTHTDTRLALQGLFGKAYAVHQSLWKAETNSGDVSTARLLADSDNPFVTQADRGRDPQTKPPPHETEEGQEVDASDPFLQAAKEDGLDFFFENTGAIHADFGTSSVFSHHGLRRVAARKSQSTVLGALNQGMDLDQMRTGFDLFQRGDNMDWDSLDTEREERQRNIEEKLRFPGSNFLARQPSAIVTMSTASAKKRGRDRKRNGGNSATMGGIGFG